MTDEVKPSPVVTNKMSYFVRHGHFCAMHPTEMLTATITFTVLLFSFATSIVKKYNLLLSANNDGVFLTTMQTNQDIHRALLTLVRCVSLLYFYYQLKTIQNLHSKFVAGMTGLFAFLSAVMFSSLLIKMLQLPVTELGDMMLFYLLWMDLSKISKMVQVRFHATSQFQLNSGIANTIGQLGPSFTLDSIIQVLVISIGLISGVRQMEILSSLALLAIITNYVIFITAFPAVMSMMGEASRKQSSSVQKYQTYPITMPTGAITTTVLAVNTATSSAASQKFLKIIVGGSFLLLQTNSYWNSTADSSSVEILQEKMPSVTNRTDDVPSELTDLVVSYLCLRFDQLILSALLLVLAIKYIFYGDKHESSPSSQPILVGNEDVHAAKDTPIQRVLPVVSCKNLNQQQQQTPHPHNQSTGLPSSSSSSSASVQTVPSRSSSVLVEGNETLIGVGQGEEEQKEEVGEKVALGEGVDSNSNNMSSSVLSPNVSRTSFRNISFTLGESESDSDLEEKRKLSDASDGEDQSSVFQVDLETKEVQTHESCLKEENMKKNEALDMRPLEECIKIYNNIEEGARCLTDAEVMLLVDSKRIPAYQLEKAVQDEERGVRIRRKLIGRTEQPINTAFEDIPFENYDYSKITGACCENVVGYIPVPVGTVGPLQLNGKTYPAIPMATTEGCLVASTNRGCRALVNGVMSKVVSDGMSRGPVTRFPSAVKASNCAIWLSEPDNYKKIKESFDGSSRFARLKDLSAKPTGRYLFIRFVAKTGDAMGMNMISKGTEVALNTLQKHFPEMEILSLSGNYCTDKKPAAINWTEGRGKSVIAESIVPAKIVQNVLKTTASALVELNIAKNLVGSAMAGSIGGFNAHAANIVAAIYIATGQDAAQCVGSSNCITLMEPWGPENEDLYISCTMPSIEVGTVGGGTVLPAQSSCLKMLGVHGPNMDEPGLNSCTLASVVCATVLAGELSLMSALAAGHLVRSHLKHNRSSANVDSSFRTCATAPATFTSITQPPAIPVVSSNNNNISNKITNCSNNSLSNKNKKDNKPAPLTLCNNKMNSSKDNRSHPSSPLPPSTIPLQTMDFLSVPSECKQF